MEERARHPWLLGLVIAAITVAVVVALATSEPSGTGAQDVGSAGAPEPAGQAPPPTAGQDRADPEPASCEATQSNPGGDNNYLPDAPARESLGEGFVVTGQVRAVNGCEPVEGVDVQVWLATQTGGEQDNRATVTTGPDGRYRIETDPTIPQFGEPNIHVAYDGEEYEDVFIRRVVDLDDERATVNLTLAQR